jgi:hypothetical protein
MAYLSQRFQPVDKTTEMEKAQTAFQAQLLGIKSGPTDKSSYRRKADNLASAGESATAYETLRRNKREAAAQEAARKKLQEETMRRINTSIGQGVGPSLTPNGTSGGGYKPTGNASFDKFMASISKQESGGSYSARNKDSGAMGKYQIMPGNLNGSGKGWDYEALGHDVSSQQFMNSPQIQEQIAAYKMQQYYNKYGPRGAAIAWYAGPGAVNNTNLNAPQGSYPSISSYVQSVLRRLGL